jgi:menaquinone-dependent protoporphyrinogen oxidase
MGTKVLIAYASRHGSTEGIARRLEAALRAQGVAADAIEADVVRDPEGYDGYVVGSAVYAGQWLGPAKAFVRHYRGLLGRHPLWLFSSGPLSSDPAERDRARPGAIDRLAEELSARGHEVFAGAWDRAAPPVGVMERVMHALPPARDALPDGDFRDWDQVDRFAAVIAGELGLALATA